MKDLQKHEQFEMEVLKLLSDRKLLSNLIFGGGTCLRLCFNLPRYSLDLDFWSSASFSKKVFFNMKTVLEQKYQITDFFEKHFSYLLEFRSSFYPQKLKIEIRKEKQINNYETELSIAFSPFHFYQVRLITFSPQQMWKNKLQAFLERMEMRDAYDLEFLYKKGYGNFETTSDDTKQKLLKLLVHFTQKDFKTALGSLLEPDERQYFVQYGFKILQNALR